MSLSAIGAHGEVASPPIKIFQQEISYIRLL